MGRLQSRQRGCVLYGILCSALMAAGPILAQPLRITAEFPLGHSGTALALTPDNRELYVAAPEDALVAIVDVRRRMVTRVRLGSKPYALAIAADGSHVYVGQEGRVGSLDTATKRLTEIPVGGPVMDLALDALHR